MRLLHGLLCKIDACHVCDTSMRYTTHIVCCWNLFWNWYSSYKWISNVQMKSDVKIKYPNIFVHWISIYMMKINSKMNSNNTKCIVYISLICHKRGRHPFYIIMREEVGKQFGCIFLFTFFSCVFGNNFYLILCKNMHRKCSLWRRWISCDFGR